MRVRQSPKNKHRFTEPNLSVSTETDAAKIAVEDKRNEVFYDKQYDRWEANVAEFKSLYRKTYVFMLELYCSTEFKRMIKKILIFATTICDDILVLLETIEQQVHVLNRVVCPLLTLTESLTRMLSETNKVEYRLYLV